MCDFGAPQLESFSKLSGRLDILATGIPAYGPDPGSYRTTFPYGALALQTVSPNRRLFSYSAAAISYSPCRISYSLCRISYSLVPN